MTLLLDTHTILWVAEDAPRLGRAAKRACNAALAADDIAIPAVAYYEIGQLFGRRRTGAGFSVRDFRTRLLSLGIREVELTAEIALRASDLENLTGDPFDRFIVATALIHQAVLSTADVDILACPGLLKR